MANDLGVGAPAGPMAQPQGMPPGAPSAMPQGAPPAEAPQTNLLSEYQKLRQAGAMLGAVRQGLDKLTSLADTVTPQDVVTEAGKLVALGLDPVQIAGMLADMPQEGDLLVEWIAQQDGGIRQRQQQLDQMTQAVRHDLGVESMRGLMAHHFANAMPPPSAQPPQQTQLPQSNALMAPQMGEPNA